MQSDPEIERIGMEKAMEYEIRNGRVPEDVSSENLGFDIRSKDGDGKMRYLEKVGGKRGLSEFQDIEVKARAGVGAVALTQNEWFKAERFKDEYYLYVVFQAASKSKLPELMIIQNPAENLNYEEKLEVVRYIAGWDEVRTKGVKG
jgi:hypothetical protein